jgi:hypothetical protein
MSNTASARSSLVLGRARFSLSFFRNIFSLALFYQRPLVRHAYSSLGDGALAPPPPEGLSPISIRACVIVTIAYSAL